ncbi:hypothetical protein A1O3_00831 [Capronia epimyces CBS 606.96]|uniref:Uncharacterized protein n=1 Tax=Capronia epimyces CBS 606.96 TaxID=1182542 RepID=W9YSN7_9EURO|nr:uncharacterized protein A1O3_00831 [Capronia epimyces CBS 606.96]EXJ92281.1 hypothetical protein A1O3_00831 [Capronia epimyces CBS 606.96]
MPSWPSTVARRSPSSRGNDDSAGNGTGNGNGSGEGGGGDIIMPLLPRFLWSPPAPPCDYTSVIVTLSCGGQIGLRTSSNFAGHVFNISLSDHCGLPAVCSQFRSSRAFDKARTAIRALARDTGWEQSPTTTVQVPSSLTGRTRMGYENITHKAERKKPAPELREFGMPVWLCTMNWDPNLTGSPRTAEVAVDPGSVQVVWSYIYQMRQLSNQ